MIVSEKIMKPIRTCKAHKVKSQTR